MTDDERPRVSVDERDGITIRAPLDVAEADLLDAAKRAAAMAAELGAARAALEGKGRAKGSPLSRPDYADLMGRQAFDARASGKTWRAIAEELLGRPVDLDDVKNVRRWARRWHYVNPDDELRRELAERGDKAAPK